MIFGIRVNGGYLDLPANTTVSFQLNNMIFSTKDSEVLPGSFQYPLTIPTTENNAKLLGLPHIINNEDLFLEDIDCDIIAGGSLLFSGLLTVRTANRFSIKIRTIVNPLKKLKATNLNQLDLGGIRTLGADSTAARATAKDAAANPLNYDYSFFPVRNTQFMGSEYVDGRSDYQNHYDIPAGEFFQGVESPNYTPFFRMDYVIRRIFEENSDWYFSNQFAVEKNGSQELKLLYLYNNYSIADSDGNWPTTFVSNNHVSSTSVTDFLRKVASTFNLGLFFDFFTRSIELIPLNDVIKLPPKHNWSGKVLATPEVGSLKAPLQICYDEDSNDDLFKEFKNQYYKPSTLTGTYETPYDLAVSGPINGPGGYFYYLEKNHHYILEFVSPAVARSYEFWWQELGCAPIPSVDNNKLWKMAGYRNRVEDSRIFKAQLQPLFDNIPVYQAIPNPYGYQLTPWIQCQGTSKYLDQSGTFSDRFMAYKGISSLAYPPSGDYYPIATTSGWNWQSQIGQFSFYMDGEAGVYENFWKAWHEKLIYARPVTMTLQLSLDELKRFNLKDKVRIDNMDYMVKTMDIKFQSSQGLLPVECELIALI